MEGEGRSGDACSRLSGILSGIRRSRAEMESADARRQSLRVAVGTPELLSALRAMGVPELAMMGDHSPSKRGWDMSVLRRAWGMPDA